MSDLSTRLDGLSRKEQAALLELIRKKKGTAAPAPVAEVTHAPPSVWEEGGAVPVSFAQERLWLLDQLAPGTSAYNIPGAFRLLGPLNVAALRQSVAEIVRRHDALRRIRSPGSPSSGWTPPRRRPSSISLWRSPRARPVWTAFLNTTSISSIRRPSRG
jgi:hypothetical protein